MTKVIRMSPYSSCTVSRGLGHVEYPLVTFGIKNYMCVESQSGIVATLVNSAFVRLKQEDRHGF